MSMLRENLPPAACPPKGSNALAESVPAGWMSQLIPLGFGEREWNMAMLQLEHCPVVGAARRVEEPSSQGPGRTIPEGGCREINQKGLAIGTHEDIPMVDVSLRNPGPMDRLKQLQESLKECDGNFAGLKVRKVTSFHVFDGKSKRIHRPSEAWDPRKALE